MAMNVDGTSLWSTIEAIAHEEGVELFDVELPSDTRRGGALRVYITKPKAEGMVSAVQGGDSTSSGLASGEDDIETEGGDAPRGGISFEECVRVSKRILDLDEQQELIPGNCTLEVSSPGINRKLRLPAHFQGAVGERVRIKFRSAESGTTSVVNGIVRQASRGSVEVEAEAKKEIVSISLSEIKEARVDFKF